MDHFVPAFIIASLLLGTAGCAGAVRTPEAAPGPAKQAAAPAVDAPDTAEGRTFYVSVKGDDANPGDEAKPFKTIAKGVSCLKPGDTLLIREGTYPAFTVRNLQGTADAVITIRGFPGEKVVIDRYPDGGVFTVHLLGKCSYLVFADFEVTDSDPAVDEMRKVDVTTPEGLAATKKFIEDQKKDEKQHYRDGVRINPPTANPKPGEGHNHLVFLRLTVHHMLGLGFTGIGEHMQFIGNHVYDLGYPRSGYGWYLSGSDNLFRDNRIHDCPYGLHLYGTAISRTVVENNTIYSNGKPFYHLSSDKVHPGGSGILLWAEGGENIIRNNVLWDNHTGINVDSKGALVVNNTVFASGKTGIFCFPKKDMIVRNNIVWKSGNKDLALDEGNTGDHNLVGVDPKFADEEKKDLDLKAGSPAIGAGVEVKGSDIDFIGRIRPEGTAWDIGAYEWSAHVQKPSVRAFGPQWDYEWTLKRISAKWDKKLLLDNNFKPGENDSYSRNGITLGEAKRILGFKGKDMELTISCESDNGPLEVRSKSGFCFIQYHESTAEKSDVSLVDVTVHLRAPKKSAWIGKDKKEK
jgi:parallel beta-helix repeat protein